MMAAPGYVSHAEHGDLLVDRHASLVNRIAHHLMGRLPDSVQVEDLIQAGMIGLLEASRNFDDSQGASFETYAGIRIRGSMLDEVRRNGWAPRSVHRKAREVAEAVRQVENREGRHAQSHEVAEVLGVSVEEYFELLRDASGQRLLSLNEEGQDAETLLDTIPDEGPGPEEGLQHDDAQRRLADGIKRLPEREGLVMSLYYDDELNLREIGAVLGVTESRVCQIHSQALLRLRSWLSD